MSSICSLDWVRPISSLAKDDSSQANESNLPPAALSSSTSSARPKPRLGRATTAADLYGNKGKSVPLNPRSSDVLQSSIGDCHVLASLMSLADQKPAQIRRAISYNDRTHNFAVTLHHEKSGIFGINRHPTKTVINVTQQDLADNIARGGGGMNADLSSPAWVTLMETALAKSLDHNWSNGLDEGYHNLVGGTVF